MKEKRKKVDKKVGIELFDNFRLDRFKIELNYEIDNQLQERACGMATLKENN